MPRHPRILIVRDEWACNMLLEGDWDMIPWFVVKLITILYGVVIKLLGIDN
jgi:hypothetical protein